MIDIDKQIKVLDTLTKRASEASYNLKVVDILGTRELVLQSFLDDLRDNPRVVSHHPKSSWELFGGKNGKGD